jgi:hypothetical protein
MKSGHTWHPTRMSKQPADAWRSNDRRRELASAGRWTQAAATAMLLLKSDSSLVTKLLVAHSTQTLALEPQPVSLSENPRYTTCGMSNVLVPLPAPLERDYSVRV